MTPTKTPASGTSTTGKTAETTLADEFEHWLERVSATHEAVLFTCTSRLHGNRAAASQVAVGVMAGMLSRPSVFRYFGLPYSGRIARLAENLLARSAAGTLDTVCSWADLYAPLQRLAPPHRDVLVLTCVLGVDIATLAEHLGSSREFATHRQNAMLTHMRRLAAPGLSPSGGPDAVTKE